jgi:hypothetical protein
LFGVPVKVAVPPSVTYIDNAVPVDVIFNIVNTALFGFFIPITIQTA